MRALVVGAEGGRDVDDARTVLGGDVVARDDAEGTFTRVDPRNQLLVFKADEVLAFEFLHDFRGLFEHCFHQGLGHQDLARFFGVGMHGLQKYIVNVRTDAKSGVARQGPRCGRPCNSKNRQLIAAGNS